MKYDRNWLIGISDTKHIIAHAPIDQVPLQYRALLKNQFNVHVEAFNTDLSLGFSTAKSQAAIADLGYLALELIEEYNKKRQAAESAILSCANGTHPSYGR